MIPTVPWCANFDFIQLLINIGGIASKDVWKFLRELIDNIWDLSMNVIQ